MMALLFLGWKGTRRSRSTTWGLLVLYSGTKYADFGWFLTLKPVSDPFQSATRWETVTLNELAKSILFEQSRVVKRAQVPSHT
jgi:hypothetical protein